MSKSMADIRKEAHLWRAKIDDGQLTPAARAVFDRWMVADPRHGEAFAEAELLWEALGDIDYVPALEQPILTERVRNAVAGACQAVRDHWRSFYTGVALASTALAVAAILLLVTVIPNEDPLLAGTEHRVFSTLRGEIQTTTLSDGSRITVGAKSHLKVELGRATRKAHLLAGSAFFDVASDPQRPFTVAVGKAEVRVVGTAFDIQTKGDKLYVAVEEGVVRVSYPTATADASDTNHRASVNQPVSGDLASVTLTAGQGVSASPSRGLGAISVVSEDALGAWRSGQLVYVRATLNEVIEDANRYTSSPIKVDTTVQDLKLSGTFNTDDIDGLLSTLEAALPVRVEVRGGLRYMESDRK